MKNTMKRAGLSKGLTDAMKTAAFFSVLSLAVELVYSQAAGYAQCGGPNWTGARTCVSGYVCQYQNPYYSQCVPGTTTTSVPTTLTTTTKTSTTTSTTSKPNTSTTSSSKTSPTVTSTVQSSCTAAFTPITASAAFAALNPGWNLGNTLDAVPDEGSWNNPAVIAGTFSAVKAEGFNSVRIPVTWAYHFVSSSPSWTVNTTWMDRVETVVDQALATGMYVILNVHHDSWTWADVSASGANLTMIEEKFSALWFQIGRRMRCKSSKLIFEPINEPPGTTQDHANEINKLNTLFLAAVNQAGGYNPQRVVTLSGLQMNSVYTEQWFTKPTTYTTQPWGFQFHYYSPYTFIFDAWGGTTWGSDADKATLTEDFQLFAGNFTGIPTLIGEWQATPLFTEPAARWKYTDYFVKTAKSFGFAHILWDNGLDFLNRATNTWDDPISMSILFNAAKGVSNSLADSTTDLLTTSQNSSANLFHKVGDAVIAQSVPYLLNGNTLSSIKTSAGTTLATTSYSISSAGVLTFTQAYLATLYSSTTAPGIKATLTLTFSAGSLSQLQIVQWATPTLSQTSFSKQSTTDLTIPINYAGLPQVAAVKALNADGSYMVSGDAWTVYLGPLQQARWTYGSWTSSSAGLTIPVAGLTAISSTGQTNILTLEYNRPFTKKKRVRYTHAGRENSSKLSGRKSSRLTPFIVGNFHSSRYEKFRKCAINTFLETGLPWLETASPISIEEFVQRRNKLAVALEIDGTDAFIVEPGYTFQYYANISQMDREAWEPEERPFLMIIMLRFDTNSSQTVAKTTFLAPNFEEGRVRMLGMLFEEDLSIVTWEEHWNPYSTLLDSWHMAEGRDHIPTKPKVMVDKEMRDFIQRGLGENEFEVLGLAGSVKRVRQTKTVGEVNIMRAVNTGTVEALRDMRKCMVLGLTENEVMNGLDSTMGAGKMEPFFDIVLFDENAAMPHGGPDGSKVLEKETLVLIDVGAHLYGYSSDIYIAARDVIADADYEKAFTHRVGHGIGIKAHESPYLNEGNFEEKLHAGIAFTHEPGVYLKVRCGVRHEDVFLVKEDGETDILTGSRKLEKLLSEARSKRLRYAVQACRLSPQGIWHKDTEHARSAASDGLNNVQDDI
ncbi:glycoside hydrolase family 5 protein [Sclerotinia borealis F-4128]|uniref:Glycoside hydrolase family 5 protein n=1 Tax=Sclerotinia borealis (strain F-4128) TaxID=1432307 RepID=W9CE92_SCLBF|nr:glycoside hydrolase family 5 protein [Sclerotinia borealis F-4128]